MTTTPILGITQVAPSQNNKETTINDGFLAIEKSLNKMLVVSLASGNVTLTSAEFRSNQLFRGQSHTVARTLTVPNQVRLFSVENKGTGILNVKTSHASSNTIAVPVNSFVILYADGVTSLVLIADSAAATSVTELTGLTDFPSSYTGAGSYYVKVKADASGVEFVAFDTTLEDLVDVDAYTNSFYAKVKSDGSGIEWVSANPGGETEFILLTDVPADYTGDGLKIVRVKSSADGLEFVSQNDLIAFTQLSDAPNSYSGVENHLVSVNTLGTALEFIPYPSFGNIAVRSVAETNAGFEEGFLTPWEATDVDFDTSFTVVTDVGVLAPYEGSYFLRASTASYANISIARTYALTAVASPAELDNTAKLAVPYAWAKTGADATLGSVVIQTKNGAGTVLSTTTISGLTGTVNVWSLGNQEINLPVGTRSITITLGMTNASASIIEFAWDSFDLLLTVKEPITFIDLPDAPSTYVAKAGFFPRVNVGETALEFVDPTFLMLADVPGTYAGQAGLALVVNVGETGLEFGAAPSAFPSFTGNAGKVLTVNTGETDAIWQTPSAGTAGADGNTILYGTAAPTTEGVDGDFYIRTTTSMIYGPKAAGVWPAGTSLIGATGPSFPAFSLDTKTASYASVSGDFIGNKMIEMNVASANTFTVSPTMTNGEPLAVCQMGSGQTTIVAGSGVTLLSADGALKLRVQNAVCSIIKVGTNTYRVSGDLTV